MRIAVLFVISACMCYATTCRAQEPAAYIVRNPYYFEPALVGSRYQVAAPAIAPPVATATAEVLPLTSQPTSSNAVEPSRSVERMHALSTVFGHTSATHERAAPRRFTPPINAKPLAAADHEITQRDVDVSPVSLEWETTGTHSSSVSLSAAVTAQLAVTRLAANPLRSLELTPVAPAVPLQSANPLR